MGCRKRASELSNQRKSSCFSIDFEGMENADRDGGRKTEWRGVPKRRTGDCRERGAGGRGEHSPRCLSSRLITGGGVSVTFLQSLEKE